MWGYVHAAQVVVGLWGGGGHQTLARTRQHTSFCAHAPEHAHARQSAPTPIQLQADALPALLLPPRPLTPLLLLALTRLLTASESLVRVGLAGNAVGDAGAMALAGALLAGAVSGLAGV